MKEPLKGVHRSRATARDVVMPSPPETEPPETERPYSTTKRLAKPVYSRGGACPRPGTPPTLPQVRAYGAIPLRSPFSIHITSGITHFIFQRYKNRDGSCTMLLQCL